MPRIRGSHLPQKFHLLLNAWRNLFPIYNLRQIQRAVKYFRGHNEDFHTYQLQEDKFLRVVIRYLHYSTPEDVITKELEELGFKVKQVTNVIIKKKRRE